MLPFRARECVQYDPAQRQLHALDWDGANVHYDTPAELTQALDGDRLYSPLLVHAAALWFAADHGVAWHLPATAPDPLGTLASRGSTEGYSPTTLQRCLQAIDRGYDRASRLAIELLSADDHLCIIDRDGLCANVFMHVANQALASALPRISWLRSDNIPDDATVVLVHTTVNRTGAPTDPMLVSAIARAQQRTLPRYAFVPFGPHDAPNATTEDSINAVVTARGIYRSDRVARYDDDADIGPDIISLT